MGYNASFVADRALRVAVIALGYADGYLRCWSGLGTMLQEGRSLPVLGRVSMDMTVIDISAAPELREGDWVEAAYSLPQASAQSGLSQYELLTLLGDRFARDLPELARPWQAEEAPEPRLLALNEALAVELGLDPQWLALRDRPPGRNPRSGPYHPVAGPARGKRGPAAPKDQT